MTNAKAMTGILSTILLLMIAFGAAFYYKNESGAGLFEARLVYNPLNDREVVGAYNNVFTGKVIADLGSSPYDSVPQKQYLVQAAYNVKGSLQGEIKVSQVGRYEEGEMQKIGEDQVPALQVGSTYLFASRLNPDTGWHVLSTHPSGLKLLSRDDLTLDRIVEISKVDVRVAQLQEAYKNEILPLQNREALR